MYGVVAVKVSPVAPVNRKSWHPLRTSSRSRVFPSPASDSSTTVRRRSPRASFIAARSMRISSIRPARANSSAAVCLGRPSGMPTDHACTGLALPLTMKGSSSTVSNRVADRSSTASLA